MANEASGCLSGPATSEVLLVGAATARVASAAATSAEATGCKAADVRRTLSPWAPDCAMAPMNSKNCVARRIE
ncbi:hypothetical protein D3C76_1644610 [compost metagenome]